MLPSRSYLLSLLGIGVAALCCVAVTILGPSLSLAHEGHDHDDGGRAALASSAYPRVTAQSETYELVGILRGDRLTIYLDRFATNQPVTDAKVAVTVGDSETIEAEPGDNGVYTVSSPRLGATRSIELVFSIAADGGDDLLVGAITNPGPAGGKSTAVSGAHAVSAQLISSIPPSVRHPIVLTLATFGLGILVGHFLRSGRFIPATAAGAAAAATLTVLIAMAGDAEHDHSDDALAAAAAMSDAPRRLSDGTAFVAKPSQRLLEVRTLAAKPESVRPAVQLIGRVIGDPNRTSLVQSIHAGRVIAPEGGLPRIGQTVRKGDVLARIESHLALADRTTISERAGEIEQLIGVTEARLQRLRYLLARGTALQSQVIEAEIELEGLRRRREVIRDTRSEPAEILRAPTDGVIAVAKVVPGQVVQAQSILFQIVDPQGLWVEALVYGELAPNSLDDAAAVGTGGQTMALTFQGFSRALQQQATIVHFAIPEPPPNLSIGQPVTVVAKSGGSVTGLVVARDAVVRSANGEAVAWLHVEPERFESRPVRTQAFDATRVVVAAGVAEGERIVVGGADLINQIR